MDEPDFEGTLVLEQLASIDKVDEFFEAIDSDDVGRAVRLMKKANVDAATIAIVVEKMETSDGEHQQMERGLRAAQQAALPARDRQR